MTKEFFKYNSNGNDFIILDNLNQSFDYLAKSSKTIQKMCTREFSIGADGLILLQKSKLADFKMKFFNKDGHEANMCGNGLLSLVKFIDDFIDKKPSFLIETKAEIYKTFVAENKVSFRSNFPKVLKESCKISVDENKFDLEMLDSGVFHGVIFTKSIEKIDVNILGKKIRNLKDFQPTGINVSFCEVIDVNKIRVRTFEKGVENETFCCSTGALAVSYSFAKKNKNIKDLVLCYRGGEIKTTFLENEILLSSNPIMAYRGFLNSV